MELLDLSKKKYTVSEVTQLIKRTLESSFSNLTIEGEISNFRPSSTGHYYFSLKDKESIIQVAMFKNRLGTLSFQPADGQLVRVRGNLSVYLKRGTYQIICESMELAGTGNILVMLEERKRKLAAEGLFATGRKKPLPLYPSRVAVVTSPTGAAIRDILRVIERRTGGINLIILPTPVQGKEAAVMIAAQIRRANRYNLGEVIIIGRGGGSLEDLLPFSEEEVVRAVAESEIPVISAVGHEVDITLSDLAADMRAPTPSAAAEIVSASREELAGRIRELHGGILHAIGQRIERVRLLLRQFTPEEIERSFLTFLQPIMMRLDDAKEEGIMAMKQRLAEFRHRLELTVRELSSNSPLAILSRGYAVVTDKSSGTILKNTADTETGRDLDIRLFQGRLTAEVKEKHN
ncbi:MAG: exodeoxyribonuclease VII large subunit [Spirochaetales bacterium]|nr:exodeoxyribonuclease VII large subunit [Spirochaetales bacterium]